MPHPEAHNHRPLRTKPEPRACAFDECGEVFVPSRDDAKYHSDSCRAKASKARRAAEVEPPPGPVAQQAPTDPPVIAPSVVDPYSGLAQRVADLESDFDLAEAARRAAGAKSARASVDRDQVQAMIRAALDDQVPVLAERVYAIERAVEEDSSLDAVPEKIRDHERTLASLTKQVAALQQELTKLARAIAAVLSEA